MSEPQLTAAEAELRVATDAELETMAQLRDEVRRGLLPAHAVVFFVHQIERDAVGEA